MNVIALVDLLALGAALIGLAFLLRGRRQLPSGVLRGALAGLLALTLFNSLSNLLEWSGVSAAFDEFEDYTQLLIPILFGLAVYELLRLRSEGELKAAAERLRRERDLVESIAQTSPAGIMLLSPEGRITFANRRAQQVLGRDADELLGSLCDPTEWGMRGPDGQPVAGEQLPYRWVVETRQPLYDAFCSVQRSDGEQVHLAVNAAPLSGPNDELLGVVMTFEDISERLRAERALRESEQKLRGVIDRSNDLIILTDESGRIIEWNASAERATGLRRQEVLNRPIWEVQAELATPEQRAQTSIEVVREAIQQALRSGEAPWLGRLSETTIQRRDGVQRTMQSIEFTIPTEQGYRIGSVMRDVTDYQQTRAALLQSERNYQQIFNASSYAMFILEASDGEILDANQRALELFGHSYGDLLRLRLAQLGAEEGPQAEQFVAQKLAEAAQGAAPRFAWVMRRSNGERFWAEAILSQMELGGRSRLLARIYEIEEPKTTDPD
jgi:PAS domain S-box-containing protein